MARKKMLVFSILLFLGYQLKAQELVKLKTYRPSFFKFSYNSLYFDIGQPMFIHQNKADPTINTFTFHMNFLNNYVYKSYKMSEFYVFHGMNTTPHPITNQYPLPSYIENQRIEIIKKRNKSLSDNT